MLLKACAAAALLLLAACSGDGKGYTPTQPPLPPPPSNATWSGTWTFDQGTPAGDCLAEALNAWRPAWVFSLQFEREAGRARLWFLWGPGFEPQEGFWPIEYTGTVDSAGTVLASVPSTWLGTLRSDPWLELCYSLWWMEGGQLSATLSADGRTLTGTIVESFRAPLPGTAFTIHSHFTAGAP